MGSATASTSTEESLDREPTPTVAVFAPSPLLTVTLESGPDDADELHLHAGGQGFWIARMLVLLGLDACLCAPLSGETGRVLHTLMADEGVDVRIGATTRGNGAYVHDRRPGERTALARIAPAVLSRHQVDELYSSTLATGIAASVTVLGGPATPDVVPADTYRRLAADLRAVDTVVVADLSGETLTAALEGGVTLLKVSHEDLIEDGRAADDDVGTLTDAMTRLHREGATDVVLSRGDLTTLALVGGRPVEVGAPALQRVDHHGAGDSMTAGLAAALARGESVTKALRVGAAAGAANVTRRGLATGQRSVVEQVAERVTVSPLV